MAYAPSFDAYGGCYTQAVAAAKSTDTVISPVPARLCRVLVTAAGSVNLQIFDNAAAGSGTLIAVIPSTAPVGTVTDFSFPATNGITVKGNAGNHGITISFN